MGVIIGAWIGICFLFVPLANVFFAGLAVIHITNMTRKRLKMG